MGNNSVIVLALTFTALCVAGAGIFTGGSGYSWWKYDSYEKGLWRSCVDATNCITQHNILEFKEYYMYKERDITLVLLIASALFLLIAGLTSIFMFCCQRNRGAWMCSAITVAICSFIGAAAGFGSVIYAEIKFEKLWEMKGVEHGWSVIAAWIGAAAAFVAFVLAVIMCCVPPQGYERHQTHYPQTQAGPQFNPGYEQGYPMK